MACKIGDIMKRSLKSRDISSRQSHFPPQFDNMWWLDERLNEGKRELWVLERGGGSNRYLNRDIEFGV